MVQVSSQGFHPVPIIRIGSLVKHIPCSYKWGKRKFLFFRLDLGLSISEIKPGQTIWLVDDDSRVEILFLIQFRLISRPITWRTLRGSNSGSSSVKPYAKALGRSAISCWARWDERFSTEGEFIKCSIGYAKYSYDLMLPNHWPIWE